MRNAILASAVVVASVLFACGGRTDGVGHESSSSSGSSGGTGSSSGGTGSSSGISSSSSGGSSGSSSGGIPACVYVDPTTYDQSCNTASDCEYITTGDVCEGFCDCGGTLVNVDGLARYEQAIAGIVPGQCGCDPGLPPSCVNHQCVVEGPDGGPPDGGTCVFVDTSTYDSSCKVDTDCTLIHSGQICSGECLCGGNAAINVDGEARYQDAIAGLNLLDCPCVAQPPPFCAGGVCLEGVAAGRAHR